MLITGFYNKICHFLQFRFCSLFSRSVMEALKAESASAAAQAADLKQENSELASKYSLSDKRVSELTAELTVEGEERKLRTPRASEEQLHLWPRQLSLKRELSFDRNNTSEELIGGDEVIEGKEVETVKVSPGDSTR